MYSRVQQTFSYNKIYRKAPFTFQFKLNFIFGGRGCFLILLFLQFSLRNFPENLHRNEFLVFFGLSFAGGMSSPRQYKEMPSHPYALSLEHHPHHMMYHPHPPSAPPELQYSYDHLYGAGGERCRSQPGGKSRP